MSQRNTSNRAGQTVVGVFEDATSAEQAIKDLKAAGFTPDTISVVTKDQQEQKDLVEASGNKAGEGALAGALVGGTLGAVIGWLLAGGTILIPGVGPAIAAGIFGATVTGALVGGAVGSISSALVGQGIPEDEAAEYEHHVKGGRSLLSVKAADSQLLANALGILDRNNATGIRYYNEGETGPGQAYSRDGLAADASAKRVSNTSSVEATDQDWASARSIGKIEQGSNPLAHLNSVNTANVDERNYGVRHTDQSAPNYRDESYRADDRTIGEESRTKITAEGGR
ncbi:MAG: general stress protein [Chloroflexota bacterium]|nr:general stress protein [Chloroflexota bacterium]